MPRKYLRVSTRATSYTKEAMESAIEKINNKELSYAVASKMYGIPTSTLSDRVLKKTAVVSTTLGRPTAIPMELEIKLANCLRIMEKWGWGLSREEVLDVTQEFVRKNELDVPFKDGRPGPDWFIAFRERHNLSIKKPQPVEYIRKKMTDPFVIHEYFTLLEETLRNLDITDPKHIWNLDETSVCLDPTRTKVVGGKGQPCTRTTYGSAKENITVLTTVNAAGEKLDPLIVFKGKYMYEQWMMLDNPEKYDFEVSYASSKKGWMTAEIFYNYMLKIVIPNLGEHRPVLLLYDGHVSHVDDKVVELAVEHDITIIKIPAHTSHLLQPLDLAVFKTFKTIWDKNLVAWQRQNVGNKVKKQIFAKMFADAWQKTRPEVIQNGFKKGGIYPFNASVIPKEKFSPSAYIRWTKHMLQVNFKQPENLKQLCLHEINRILSGNSISAMETQAPREGDQAQTATVSVSFENLLLEKVSGNPANNISVKLKRVAKGAEVITKTYLENKKEAEANNVTEKETQEETIQQVSETTKRKKIPKQEKAKQPEKKKTSQKKPPQPESDPQPGTSGIQIKKVKQKAVANNVTEKETQEETITIQEVSETTTKKKTPKQEKSKQIEKKETTQKKLVQTNGKSIPYPEADPQLGTSGVQKKNPKVEHTNTSQTTEEPKYIATKKGKGIGKKSRKLDKENATPNDLSSHCGTDPVDLKVHNPELMKKCPTKKRKLSKKRTARTYSDATTIESIEVSMHSDSDIIDTISHSVIDDFDNLWTELNNSEEKKTEFEELLSREEEIEKIVKEIHKMESKVFTGKICEDSNGKEDIENKENDNTEEEIKKTGGKVTILSSVTLTPENQAFYKTCGGSQLKPVDTNMKLPVNRKRKITQNENIPDTYDIGDTVLVRYYKKNWKYYVGVIMGKTSKSNHDMAYNISYYRTVGSKNNVKFVIPKRKDEDCVPTSNIVKKIELLQFKEDPAEFALMEEDDENFF